MHIFSLAFLYDLLYIISSKYTFMKKGSNWMMKEKVVLAYSGGLDTTAIIPWLKENYDYEVICC